MSPLKYSSVTLIAWSVLVNGGVAPVRRWAVASWVIAMEWEAACASDVATAEKVAGWLLLKLNERKSLLSLRSSNAALTLLSAYFTAAYPEIVAWFLLIFLFIASARGDFSASTKPCASDATSIPEPVPSLLMMPALALVLALLVAAVLELLEVPVLAVVLVDDVDEDTDVTMAAFS